MCFLLVQSLYSSRHVTSPGAADTSPRYNGVRYTNVFKLLIYLKLPIHTRKNIPLNQLCLKRSTYQSCVKPYTAPPIDTSRSKPTGFYTTGSNTSPVTRGRRKTDDKLVRLMLFSWKDLERKRLKMSRAMVPSQQKLAEKLTILNDRGRGMLTRIYNIKKVGPWFLLTWPITE